MIKWFKSQSGRFVAVLIALVLASVITVGAGKLPFLKADITPQQVMTMDEKAVETVRALDEDVQIFYLATDDGKELWVDELIQKYDRMSDRITYRMIDPAGDKAASLAAQAGVSLAENCLVVASADRCAVIGAENLYDIVYNQMYYYYYGQMVAEQQSFAADSELVNAILYVTRDDLPVLYAVSGHGETALTGLALEQLQVSNVIYKNLTLTEAVPENAAAVLLNAPATDLTAEEADVLIEYLKQGGDLILITGYTMEGRPNLEKVTSYYGMSAVNGLVLEMTSGYCYSAEYPQYLTPDVSEHEVTAVLAGAGAKALVQQAGAIKRSNISRSGLTVTELMNTSPTAYLKTSELMTTIEQEETDPSGKYTIAMAAEEGDTRIVWIAGKAFLSEADISISGGSNLYVLNGALNWMVDIIAREEITDENLLTTGLTVDRAHQPVFFALLFVPALIVLAAGLICSRRKKA